MRNRQSFPTKTGPAISQSRDAIRGRKRGFRHWGVECLEERRLLSANPPFAVGGDPGVNPLAFQVTTFASGLTYPKGITTLSDGSLLAGTDTPGTTNYYDPNSTGQILRLTDTNHDGVADNAGTVLYSGLPGQVVAVKQAGNEILALSSLQGHEQIAFLKMGATPSAPLTLMNTLAFSYSNPNWEHTTFELAVRPSPTVANAYDVFFNIGSEFNGVTTDGNGNIVPEPSTGTASWSGIANNTGEPGDAIYAMTLTENLGIPAVSNVRQVATGLRNAASMAFDPSTGDLIIADNGMDGIPDGNQAWSADTLVRIPAAMVGNTVVDFGFPYTYYRTTDTPGGKSTLVNPNPNVPTPVVRFDPLVDPNLPASGSESEGSSAIAIAPKYFPSAVTNGVFVGFHGIFNSGGTANEENPVVFASLKTSKYFDFISNDLANIGHIDDASSTDSTLYLSDLSSIGDIFGSGGLSGMIYAIRTVDNPPKLGTLSPVSVKEGSLVTFNVTATDPDPDDVLTYSLGPGAPIGATINPQTGLFSYTPPNGPATIPITIRVTDRATVSDTKSFVITVSNVAPVIAPIPNTKVPLKTAFHVTGAFTDPGVSDGWTGTVNYGDRTVTSAINVNANRTFQLSHAYATSGTFTVTVTISDQDHGIGTRTFLVRSTGPIPSSFNNPGHSQPAVFRPSTAQWFAQAANGAGQALGVFGASNFVDVPIAGDYARTDASQLAVFRPATAQWFGQSANGGGHALGVFGDIQLTDIPISGDFLGLGYDQKGVFRPSTAQWFVEGPNGGVLLGTFGATGLVDIPVPGDYDGLGRTELAVFRPLTAQWFILRPNGGQLLANFGESGLVDIPAPGNYDGTGNTQVAVFRPSTAQWFVLRPNGGALLTTFGATNYVDIPTETSFGALLALGKIGGGIRYSPAGVSASGLSSGATKFEAATPIGLQPTTPVIPPSARSAAPKPEIRGGVPVPPASTATRRPSNVPRVATETVPRTPPGEWRGHRFGRFRHPKTTQ